MKIGSLVETVTDFAQVREEWGFAYPHKGDILTVSNIGKHPNDKVSTKGIVLLYFEERPDLSFGICDRQIDGKENFKELQRPMDLSFMNEIQFSVKELNPA